MVIIKISTLALTHVHTHMCVWVYMYIYMCVYLYIYVCVYIYMYMCIYLYAYVRVYVYKYVYICIYLRVYVCIDRIMRVCMHICNIKALKIPSFTLVFSWLCGRILAWRIKQPSFDPSFENLDSLDALKSYKTAKQSVYGWLYIFIDKKKNKFRLEIDLLSNIDEYFN